MVPYRLQPVGIPRAPSTDWVQSSTTSTSAPAASASPVRTAIIPRRQGLLTNRPVDGWVSAPRDARALPRRVVASDVTPLAADGGAVEADGLEQAQDHAEMFLA